MSEGEAHPPADRARFGALRPTRAVKGSEVDTPLQEWRERGANAR
jgi:hypothetical protein